MNYAQELLRLASKHGEFEVVDALLRDPVPVLDVDAVFLEVAHRWDLPTLMRLLADPRFGASVKIAGEHK